MINPDTFSLLTSDQLRDAIPDYDWFGGHSGTVLNKDQAEKLEELWRKYMTDMAGEFRSRLELLDRRDNMLNDQLYVAPHYLEKIFG